MSLKGGAVSQGLVDYVADTFTGEELSLLREMWTRAQAAGLPQIMIAPEQARLVRILAAASGAARALDVGTLFGYSAANLALGMDDDGEVVTVDVQTKCTKVAIENFEALGIADRVDARTGEALTVMKEFKEHEFDLLLVDADKVNYWNYFEEGVRIVRPGGLVLFDNAFAFGRLLDTRIDEDDPDAQGIQAIRDFNRRFAEDDRVESLILPVGDGFAVGVLTA